MKLNPDLNIYQISDELMIPVIKISEAQHAVMAKCLHAIRYSPLWNVPYYRVDPRNWLSTQQLKAALLKIENGEKGVYEALLKSYRISPEYKKQLLAVK